MICAAGATNAILFKSSSLKKRSATLMIPFFPIFLLAKLLPMVILFVQFSRPKIDTTLNNWLEGIWSITVPFSRAATFSSFFSSLMITENKRG